MSSVTAGAPIGAVLDGKFRVKSEIGRGGMASVYAAENVDIGKPVAVKILAAEYTTSKTVTERFLREARAAAKIRSPYICEVYDVGTYGGRPFIVMELLNGESLYERLARKRRLAIDETLRIATQVAEGLKRAHENNVVHRDLKPENIFLTKGIDDEEVSKVVDFGLAKFYEPHQDEKNARLTKEGALFGTPAYMSPEQAKAKGSVDHRSDLWALGCIVYEMLTGRTVWDVEQGVAMILAQVASTQLPDPSEHRRDLPPEFGAWFRKALARNVEQRFSDTDEFAAGLKAALTAEPRRLSGPPKPPRPARTSVPPPLPGADKPAGADKLPGVDKTSLPPGAPAAPAGPASPPPLAISRFPAGAQPGRPTAVVPELVAPVASANNQDAASNQRHSDSGLERGIDWSVKGLAAWPRRQLALTAAPLVFGIGAGLFWFSSSGPKGTGEPLAETSEDALVVAEGQLLLLEEKPEEALPKFQAAFDQGQNKAARSLLTHSRVATDKVSGSCRLRGIGHPRSFNATSASSKPFVAQTDAGLVVVWADKDATGKVQGRSARLDAALRRVTQPVVVTPEARYAREPELFLHGDNLALHYWDFSGKNPGAFVRALDENGQLAGQPQILGSQVPSHAYYPSVAADSDGNVWAVWVEPTRTRVTDLVVRKLSSALEPLTQPTAVTGYATRQNVKVHADRPSLQVVGEMLFITYTLRRGADQQVLLLLVPTKAAAAGSGVAPAREAVAPDDEESDRFLGQAKQLSEGKSKHGRSTLSCGDAGCFVSWDEIPGGAHFAQVDASGKLQWTRLISADGARPSLTVGDDGGMLAWYDARQKRVKVAPFTPEAVGEPSIVGRVNAVMNHPQPQVAAVRAGMLSASDEAGWYIAWQGYEAAVQEPFIARAGCQ